MTTKVKSISEVVSSNGLFRPVFHDTIYTSNLTLGGPAVSASSLYVIPGAPCVRLSASDCPVAWPAYIAPCMLLAVFPAALSPARRRGRAATIVSSYSVPARPRAAGAATGAASAAEL